MTNILPIVLHPHPALRAKAQPVAQMSDDIRAHLTTMLETVRGANGIGLAAPQVALPQRLVVIVPTGKDDAGEGLVTPEGKPLLMANPTILEKSDEMMDSEEGCLSIPWMYQTIKRHEWVKVGYLDENGNPQTIEGENLLGRCLQHELDHLDGVLFLDHLSKLKRDMLMKKYHKVLPDFLEEHPYPTLQDRER